MESITLDQPSIKLAGVPSSGASRRRSSRAGGRFLNSGGIRKNSSASNNGDGRTSPIVRMGEMAAILGSSSPDVSPTTSGPTSGLPSVRDGLQLSMNLGNLNGINSNGSGNNNNSVHRGGPGSDHGSSVAEGRGRASSQASDRDVHMSGVSQSGSQINGSNGQSRKRQSVDGVEYPRRRATIAVCIPHFPLPRHWREPLGYMILIHSSAKFVDQERADVMDRDRNAVSALSSMRIVSIESPVSSSMQATN